MPPSPRYGIRARSAALGVLRERGAAASGLWLPPDYDPSHYLWTATPGYVYADEAGTVLLEGPDTARSWRAVNGTLAVSNVDVAWDGVDTFTHTGTQYWDATISENTGSETILLLFNAPDVTVFRQVYSLNDSITRLFIQYSKLRTIQGSLELPIQNDTDYVVLITRNASATTTVLRVNGTEASHASFAARNTTVLRIGSKQSESTSALPFVGTLSAFYLAQYAADATRRAALEASFATEFEVTV